MAANLPGCLCLMPCPSNNMKNSVQIRPPFLVQPSHSLRLLGISAMLALGSALPGAAQFIPGEGGAIPNLPELLEPETSITSLWVSQTDRENNIFTSGNRPVLDLKFKTPASYGATGFDLQKSSDGINGWETLHSTSSENQDNFSFNPEGNFFFRLLVIDGPRDGQVSNIIEGQTSAVPTQFSGWGGGTNWMPDAPMAPWVGHGLTAYFNSRNLSDSSPVTGGVDFQWYRNDPQTGAMIPIPGAIQDTYTTTEDDLGGYRLVCRGTGDGVTVGGYAHVMMDGPVVIFNQSGATSVTRSGFTLNLYKRVPSLTMDDLKLSYWGDMGEVVLPITAVTAHEGNATFDIEANIPSTVEQAFLSNQSDVWKIGELFGEGEWAHQVRDLTITFPTVGDTSFDDWADESGIPADRREPLDRNGPLKIQNLLAYAMGLNPVTASSGDMPKTASPDPEEGTIHFIYRRAKNSSEATLTPKISTDLKTWSDANVIVETILEDGGNWETVDATIELTPGTAAYFNLSAIQTP